MLNFLKANKLVLMALILDKIICKRKPKFSLEREAGLVCSHDTGSFCFHQFVCLNGAAFRVFLIGKKP